MNVVSYLFLLLSFRHVFHKVCVDPWLLDQRNCPMCKLDILKFYGFTVSASFALSNAIEHMYSIECYKEKSNREREKQKQKEKTELQQHTHTHIVNSFVSIVLGSQGKGSQST